MVCHSLILLLFSFNFYYFVFLIISNIYICIYIKRTNVSFMTSIGLSFGIKKRILRPNYTFMKSFNVLVNLCGRRLEGIMKTWIIFSSPAPFPTLHDLLLQ
jgi:hypothetical protein